MFETGGYDTWNKEQQEHCYTSYKEGILEEGINQGRHGLYIGGGFEWRAKFGEGKHRTVLKQN